MITGGRHANPFLGAYPLRVTVESSPTLSFLPYTFQDPSFRVVGMTAMKTLQRAKRARRDVKLRRASESIVAEWGR